MIELNKKYSSEIKANTDLHAGGIFSCILYRRCLLFLDNNEVLLTEELVDAFRPSDNQDVRRIENYRAKGRYGLNDRKYLECHFEEVNLTLTGLPTEKKPAIVAFHAYDSRLQRHWSEVFTLEQ